MNTNQLKAKIFNSQFTEEKYKELRKELPKECHGALDELWQLKDTCVSILQSYGYFSMIGCSIVRAYVYERVGLFESYVIADGDRTYKRYTVALLQEQEIND